MGIVFTSALGILVGFILAWVLMGGKDEKQGIVKERSDRKNENKEKILEYIKDKDNITNDDIEKMLGVSHTTAYRYLEELEKEGVLRQIGDIGQGVYYEKV